MNVIFVKWGTKYSSDDVNNLYYDLIDLAYPSHKFYCLTDDPTGINPSINIIDIPSSPILKVWWNKLYMFSKDFPLKGKCMFFDLDTYIRSDPFYICDSVNWSNLTMVSCSFKKEGASHSYDVRVNSQVLTWDADNPYIHSIWDLFLTNKDYYLRKYKGIDRFIVHENFKHDTFPKVFTQSYKYEQNTNFCPVVTFEEVDYGSSDIKSWIEADKQNL